MPATSPTTNSLPISCYIRTLNEAARIADVITAAQQIAHEVIVVDSGSTDHTVAIAQELGATVVYQKWLGNGYQKRVGEQACGHQWLLDLDADEIVSEALADEIKTMFAAGDPQCDVVQLNLTTVDPTGAIWHKSGTSWRAKLYRRSVFEMPEHGAWDQFNIPPTARAMKLKSPLLHYCFCDMAFLAIKQAQAMRKRTSFIKSRSGLRAVLRVLFSFPFYFFKKFCLQGLWRQGVYGFMMSIVCAYSRWLRDALLAERNIIEKRKNTATPATTQLSKVA